MLRLVTSTQNPFAKVYFPIAYRIRAYSIIGVRFGFCRRNQFSGRVRQNKRRNTPAAIGFLAVVKVKFQRQLASPYIVPKQSVMLLQKDREITLLNSILYYRLDHL